jgi:hypothetical protein
MRIRWVNLRDGADYKRLQLGSTYKLKQSVSAYALPSFTFTWDHKEYWTCAIGTYNISRSSTKGKLASL